MQAVGRSSDGIGIRDGRMESRLYGGEDSSGIGFKCCVSVVLNLHVVICDCRVRLSVCFISLSAGLLI